MAKIKYNGNITDLATGKSAVIKCKGTMLDGDVIVTGACKIAYEGTTTKLTAQQSVVVKGGMLMEDDAIVTATDGGDSGDSGSNGGESGGTDDITDLTGTTWQLKGDWNCTSEYGVFDVNCKLNSDSVFGENEPLYHRLYIGYIGANDMNGGYSTAAKENRITLIRTHDTLPATWIGDGDAYYLHFYDGVDIENRMLIAWLKSNAKLVEQPEEPEEPEQYTLSGTWVFNETISIFANNGQTAEHYVSFSSNGRTFGRIYGNYDYANDEWSRLLYTKTVSLGGAFESDITVFDGIWTYEAYRIIIFDGTQTVSKEFYDLFTANAVEQTYGYTFRALYDGMNANMDITVVGNVADLQGDITDVITGYGCHERVADGTIYDNVSIVMIADLYVNGNDFESITQNALYTLDDNTPINTNADIVAAVGKLCYLVKDCEIVYSD